MSLVDVDECLERTHNCSNKNGCKNTPGNYTCTCETGYYLDSDQRTCKGLLSPNLSLGNGLNRFVIVNFPLLFQTLMSVVHTKMAVVTKVVARIPSEVTHVAAYPDITLMLMEERAKVI